MIGQKYDVICFDLTHINIKREEGTEDVRCGWGKRLSQSTQVPISLIHIFSLLFLFCMDQGHHSPCSLLFSTLISLLSSPIPFLPSPLLSFCFLSSPLFSFIYIPSSLLSSLSFPHSTSKQHNTQTDRQKPHLYFSQRSPLNMMGSFNFPRCVLRPPHV